MPAATVDQPVAGYGVTEVELRHRKALLSKALSFDDPLRYATHRDAEGEVALRQAHLEGRAILNDVVRIA